VSGEWWEGRRVVRRPDVPGHLNVDALQLIRSDEERRVIGARLDAACAEPTEWPDWLWAGDPE
jgi:hypothetical protein